MGVEPVTTRVKRHVLEKGVEEPNLSCRRCNDNQGQRRMFNNDVTTTRCEDCFFKQRRTVLKWACKHVITRFEELSKKNSPPPSSSFKNMSSTSKYTLYHAFMIHVLYIYVCVLVRTTNAALTAVLPLYRELTIVRRGRLNVVRMYASHKSMTAQEPPQLAPGKLLCSSFEPRKHEGYLDRCDLT